VRGLEGKRVVVTGGARGIGAATVERFRAEGSEVFVLERDPGPDGIRVDVSDGDGVRAAFAELGRIDVVVSNAGVSERGLALEIDERRWRRVLDTNLLGVFNVAQTAGRAMLEAGGGVILNTASTNGYVGHPYYADYNASKAGVILLAKTMALELAPKVRVNSVCPGYVLTPMQRAEYSDEMLAEVNAGIPLGRHATPEEIAALFAFLASDEGAYFTGATISIDGGEIA